MNEILMEEGKRYIQLKEQRDALEEQLKAVKSELTAVSEDMVEQMDGMELDKFSAYGRTFSIRRTFAANCLAEDKEALFQCLREQGHGSLIREDVNSRTLSAFVKEQMTEDGVLPEWLEGLVTPYYKSDISLRKAGKA